MTQLVRTGTLVPHHPQRARVSPLRKTLTLGASVALLMVALAAPVRSAEATVDLATADSFAVLAGETITNSGLTTITGDIGLHPGSEVTGFGPGADAVTQIDGDQFLADAVALQAKTDLVAAYDDAAGRTPTEIGTELGGEVLLPGVYDSASGTFEITGTVTLDAGDDPDAVFIFQMAATLLATTNSTVALVNGADPCNVFWQVGSSATLQSDAEFQGTILALTTIALGDAATVEGRLLARNGEVTLIGNTITRPVCAAVVAPTAGPTAGPTDGGPAPTNPPTSTVPPTSTPPDGGIILALFLGAAAACWVVVRRLGPAGSRRPAAR